jgi:hypothetical protein
MDLVEVELTGTAGRHPWEVARYGFFRGVLADHGLLASPKHVLDVGAGDAWFATRLLESLPGGSSVTCWDSGYTDASARKLGVDGRSALKLVAERPALRADLVLLLDVLEHIDDDAGFLAELLAKNTKPGAQVLVSVPAWPLLFSSHDTYLSHFRRYTPAQGRRLVEGAGLRIVAGGGLFHSLLLPRAIAKTKEATLKSLGRAGNDVRSQAEWRGGRAITWAVQTALGVDNRVSRLLARAGMNAPGLSWWALCTT